MVNPRTIEVAALATDYGFRRVRQDRIMEAATDLYVAARAETRKECYAEIEQSLIKILHGEKHGVTKNRGLD